MSAYIVSTGDLHDQRYGTTLAELSSGFSYELDSGFQGLSEYFLLQDSTLSLAPDVYFDFEQTALIRETDDATYSLDIGEANNWAGVYLVETGSAETFPVNPSFVDLNEAGLFQDEKLDEHTVNGIVATLNLSEIEGIDGWRFRDSSLDNYFSLSSTEIRLNNGYHFDFIDSDQLDLKKITVGDDGSVSWSEVSIPSTELGIQGYGSDDSLKFRLDTTVSVTDIEESWSLVGTEFTEYEYGEAFAELTSSELAGGTVRSTNDLFTINDGTVSFASDSRYAGEDDRIENFAYEGFELDTTNTVVSHFAFYGTGQSYPGYVQSVSKNDLNTIMSSNARPLNRIGIEDNVILSSLVSNSWFLDHQITYQFDPGGQVPEGADDYNVSGLTIAWNDSQKQVMREAMDLIASVSGLTFIEVDAGQAADKNLQLVQTIKTYAGYSGYPYDETFVVDADDFDIAVLVHEMCHAVGIAHPFESGHGTTALGGVVRPTDLGDNELNTSYWSVMSYGNGMPEVLDLPLGTPIPSISTFDIAALQSLYGTNDSSHSAATAWGIPSEIVAIWDGGGFDSIDFSGANSACLIDLRSAPIDGSPESGGYKSYSPSAEFAGAYLISQGVEIESAYGGSGNDILRGSALDNLIDGGDGDDQLYPGTGSNYLLGDEGKDTFYLEAVGVWGSGFYARNVGVEGETGSNQSLSLEGRNRFESLLNGGNDVDTLTLTDEDDAFFLHDALSGLHELIETDADSSASQTAPRIESIEKINGGGGDDLIDLTSTDFSLAGQDMTITGGPGNDILWAGSGDDRLEGGDGNDQLFGGAGSDTLHGGSGADVFQFTDSSGIDEVADFDLNEDRIELLVSTGASSVWELEDGLFRWGSVEILLVGLEAIQSDDLSVAVAVELI